MIVSSVVLGHPLLGMVAAPAPPPTCPLNAGRGAGSHGTPVSPSFEAKNSGLEVLLLPSHSQQLRLEQVVPAREALPLQSSSTGKKQQEDLVGELSSVGRLCCPTVGVISMAQTSSPYCALSRAGRAFISAGLHPPF